MCAAEKMTRNYIGLLAGTQGGNQKKRRLMNRQPQPRAATGGIPNAFYRSLIGKKRR